ACPCLARKAVSDSLIGPSRYLAAAAWIDRARRSPAAARYRDGPASPRAFRAPGRVVDDASRIRTGRPQERGRPVPSTPTQGEAVATAIRLDGLRRAWDARDPELVRLIELMAEQRDEEPKAPVREGAPTFKQYLTTISSRAFRKKPPEE